MDYGKRIKALRMERGFSQQALADAAGTAKGTIQQYEAGKRQPRLEQLGRIADALGVPISDLLGVSGQDAAQMEKYEIYRGRATAELEAARSSGASPDVIANIEQIIAISEDAILERARQPVSEIQQEPKKPAIPLSAAAEELLAEFAKLSEEGQQIAIGRMRELAQIPAYCKHRRRRG